VSLVTDPSDQADPDRPGTAVVIEVNEESSEPV